MGYISKEEKLNILAVIGFEQWLDTYIPHVKDKQIKQWLKTAKTYLNKAWEARIKNLDIEQAMSMIKLAKQYKIDIMPKTMNYTQFDSNDIMILVSCAQKAKCITCENPEGECELKEVLQHLGIQGTSSGACPYDIYNFKEVEDL